MDSSALFLPGVDEQAVRAALGRAGGNELESGKFASPESSAALAVNSFGWFVGRPGELPPFPPLADVDWPAVRVDVERQMRFPWAGGLHPWLDAAVETQAHLIGVESKRFEPFRDSKTVAFSPAYDRDVWGDRMEPFTRLRDALRQREIVFEWLDAAQLVKHAFGLVTEERRIGKTPILLYLFAEPSVRGRTPIPPSDHTAHRAEIDAFAAAVAGAAVGFAACSYGEWLSGWTGDAAGHANALQTRFGP